MLSKDSSEDAYAQAERSLKGMTLPPASGASFVDSVKKKAGRDLLIRNAG